MPVVAEHGFFFKRSHRGTGYATGPTETIEHHVIPGSFSIHVGLSRVQATTDGPLGAAVPVLMRRYAAVDADVRRQLLRDYEWRELACAS